MPAPVPRRAQRRQRPAVLAARPRANLLARWKTRPDPGFLAVAGLDWPLSAAQARTGSHLDPILRRRRGWLNYGAMLRFGVVVLGVRDAQRAADFWTAALGYEVREGYGGWARVLAPPDGSGNVIALQRSQEPPPQYPHLHLDLHVDSPDEQEREAGRLVALGGRRADWDRYPDDPDFVVLEDTEGNRFCIVDLSHDHS
jgi:catechol 2,3-dioxygenase-like lactoylglutathione lyase family enzyme